MLNLEAQDEHLMLAFICIAQRAREKRLEVESEISYLGHLTWGELDKLWCEVPVLFLPLMLGKLWFFIPARLRTLMFLV